LDGYLLAVLHFYFFSFFPGEKMLTVTKNIKVGLFMGIPFGLIFMLTTSMVRKSQKFWDYSKEVQTLIDKAETKESLQSIADNEFKTLMALHQGQPHGTELTRLWTTIKTKYKYVS
jgi:hypothetical protein